MYVAKAVAFERQQTMHIADVSQVIAPTRFYADALLPGMDELEDARHDGTRERGWAFREPSDELVEELFCGDLKVKRISAHLDKGIE
jgi:hypothetical protein